MLPVATGHATLRGMTHRKDSNDAPPVSPGARARMTTETDEELRIMEIILADVRSRLEGGRGDREELRRHERTLARQVASAHAERQAPRPRRRRKS